MVTRLERRHGQLLAVVTEPAPGVDVGLVYRVVGTELAAGERGALFTGATADRRRGARPGGSQRQTYPPDFPERARSLRAEGHTYQQVADELGVTFAVAKWWLSSRSTSA